MVPYGYSVDLYQKDSFTGDIKTVVGPMFRDNTLAMDCIRLDGYNDEVTSLIVKRT